MTNTKVAASVADTNTFADVRDRELSFKRAPLKDLLLMEKSRHCNNAPMVIIFWAHILAICGLIIYVMTHESTAASVGFLGLLVQFLAESEVGKKLFEVMIWTCITGGLFAIGWVWFLRCCADKSITISIVIAHIIVTALLIWAGGNGYNIIIGFYVIVLLAKDA